MRFGNRDVVDVAIRDITSKKPVVFLDSLKMSSTDFAGQTVYAYGGRGNPKRIGWDASREVKFSCEDGLISPESLALLLGSDVVTGVQYVPVTEALTVVTDNTGVITVTAGATTAGNITFTVNGSAKVVAVAVGDSKLVVADKIKTAFDLLGYATNLDAAGTDPVLTFKLNAATLATLTFTDTGATSAVATTSVNTVSVTTTKTPYVSDLATYPVTVNASVDGSSIGTELTAGSPVNTAEYSIVGNVVTVNATTYHAGDRFIVTYYTATTVKNKRVKVTADQFPKTFELTGYTLWRSEDGVDYPCRVTIPKAKLLPAFQMQGKNEGDPSTFKFDFEVLKDSSSQDMVIYDIDEDDALE